VKVNPRSYFRQMRALRLEDFKDLPGLTELERASVPGGTLEVSLLIPAREATHSLETTLHVAHAYLTKRFGSGFEIILIPNPPPDTETDTSIRLSEELASRFTQVKVVPHLIPPHRPGKGAALRTGFSASSGKMIFFTDADLPYDLSFFDVAVRRLAQGFDLVTANRRTPDSRFDIPTALLPVAYSRHRLGLIFNSAMRFLFPLKTTDTQAGIKAMSRRLALLAFSKQRCPGFFFDLEIFLTCRGQRWAQAEVPVTLKLNTEKSTVRVLRESVLALFWLLRIWMGYLTGYYGWDDSRSKVLERYKNLGFGTRLFLTLRWWLTPYDQMAAHLPQNGVIYDLGCGHGLFSIELAQASSERQIVGLDHDSGRIETARRAGEGITNLRFENGDLSHVQKIGRPTAISIIDVLHYFDPSTQESHLTEAWRLLPQQGVLIFREVDPDGGMVSKWNRLYEKIATSVGFTRSKETSLFFRTQDEWLEVMEKIGFQARAFRCSGRLFADVLYVGEKI
jgi:dolichyl-phosphate beta-glucosyltransferase